MSPSAGLLKWPGSLPSQNKFALRFPIFCTNATCSGSQVSSVVDLTLEVSTPSERWTPLQLRHTKTPRLTDAQVGPLALQSAHLQDKCTRVGSHFKNEVCSC